MDEWKFKLKHWGVIEWFSHSQYKIFRWQTFVLKGCSRLLFYGNCARNNFIFKNISLIEIWVALKLLTGSSIGKRGAGNSMPPPFFWWHIIISLLIFRCHSSSHFFGYASSSDLSPISEHSFVIVSVERVRSWKIERDKREKIMSSEYEELFSELIWMLFNFFLINFLTFFFVFWAVPISLSQLLCTEAFHWEHFLSH